MVVNAERPRAPEEPCLRHGQMGGHIMYESAAGVKRKIWLGKDFFLGF